MTSVAGRVVCVALVVLIATSLALGQWVLALLHAHTLFLALLVDDSVTTRRRLREVEATLRELIET